MAKQKGSKQEEQNSGDRGNADIKKKVKITKDGHRAQSNALNQSSNKEGNKIGSKQEQVNTVALKTE